MLCMRTTLNIDDDLLQKLRQEAERSRTPLNATVNRALRLGMERMAPKTERPRYQCPTYAMGFPPVSNLDKALQLAAQLEDEEVIQKLGLGK